MAAPPFSLPCPASHSTHVSTTVCPAIYAIAIAAIGHVISTAPVAAAAPTAAVTPSLRPNNEGSFFSMAEEQPDGEFSDSDQANEMSSATAPEADVSQDSIEDKASIPRARNSAVLVLSWGVFSIGLYFFCAAAMGYYEGNVTEAKLAFTVLLGILTYPIGMFLRTAAHHGFRDTIRMLKDTRGYSQG